jgi:BCD family chlorophyll transporter-like MFS transporter
MNLAPADQSGLALGAWGAVQATAAGIAVALGGILRDLVASFAGGDSAITQAATNSVFSGPALGYTAVYGLEILLLLVTLLSMRRLIQPNAAPAFSLPKTSGALNA